jgi:hypothetical protein
MILINKFNLLIFRQQKLLATIIADLIIKMIRLITFAIYQFKNISQIYIV